MLRWKAIVAKMYSSRIPIKINALFENKASLYKMFLLNDSYLRIITDCLRQCPPNFFKFMSTCKLQRLQLCVHTIRYSRLQNSILGTFHTNLMWTEAVKNFICKLTLPALATYLNVSAYSGNYYKCFITHFGCEIIFWSLVAFWCKSGSFINFLCYQ